MTGSGNNVVNLTLIPIGFRPCGHRPSGNTRNSTRRYLKKFTTSYSAQNWGLRLCGHVIPPELKAESSSRYLHRYYRRGFRLQATARNASRA